MSDELTAALVAFEERITAQLARIDERLDKIEAGRKKGGRPRYPIKVTAEHTCGLDPERDSSTCPDASLYRRRQGCLGDACVQKSADYYRGYKRD
jgi:hypothetical protein